jgi:DNA-binding transcriptional regulator YhcF (GntR family)
MTSQKGSVYSQFQGSDEELGNIDLVLAFHERDPLYSQLYLHIRQLIQSGSLPAGAKLPSIRSLRQQLKISKTTIETAYHMLLEEGGQQGTCRLVRRSGTARCPAVP